MIEARNLSKRYTIYSHATDRLHDWLLPFGPRRGRPFWALRDIDLKVARGTSLGVVGVNGAGKSTLLKLLTGTAVPTTGEVRIEGRVAALLELGMGFHPEFTGMENIGYNGKMLGMTDAELAAKTPEIVDFAEIGDFIDQPLRTYSSGMSLRLAFAVAASMNPEVLIVDEALSVGDVHFQQKCLARIRKFHDQGVTVLFVSHDPGMVKSFCDEAILLDGGRIVDRDTPDQVLDHYTALLAERHREEGGRAKIVRPKAAAKEAKTGPVVGPKPLSKPAAPEPEAPSGQSTPVAPESAKGAAPLPAWLDPAVAAEEAAKAALAAGDAADGFRTGNFDGAIVDVRIEAAGTGGDSRLLSPGMNAAIVVRAVALARISRPTVGVLIKDRLGNEVYGTNTAIRGERIEPLSDGDAVEVRFAAPMNLGPGVYTVTVALHAGETHTELCYDWVERAIVFQVLPSPIDRFIGVCRLDMRTDHRREQATAADLETAKEARATAEAGAAS